MANNENRKDEVKEAVIEALSKKIVAELAEKVSVPIGKNSKDGSVRVEPSSKDSEAVKYLVRRLAEKRYEYGLAMKKEIDEW